MQDFKSKITIAIPTFERYEYFEDAINSALRQTIAVSILVIDNCSSHNKFRDFVELLDKPHVKYLRNTSNVGMVENWNRCIEVTQTEWITILHSDDMLSPTFIETMVLSMLKNPCTVGFVADTHFGFSTRKDFERPRINYFFPFNKIKPKHFLLGNPIPFPGVLFNKTVIKNRFDTAMYPISDYVFWYRLSLTCELKFINRKVAYYRISPEQETSEVFKKIVQMGDDFKKSIPKGNIVERYISSLDTYITYSNYRKTHGTNENNLISLSPPLTKELESHKSKFIPYRLQVVFVKIIKRIYISLTSF